MILTEAIVGSDDETRELTVTNRDVSQTGVSGCSNSRTFSTSC
jgi:hypothetical protein